MRKSSGSATLSRKNGGSIVNRYQIAAIIREIYDDVKDNNGTVYGARAVKVIKKAFGLDDTFIYQALHVAETFTPEQIEEMARMRLPGGKPVCYSHVVALSRVEDNSDREKLLKKTVKEGWTTRQLDNAVNRVVSSEPGQPEERRGRPLAKPKDFDAVLDQQVHFVEDFLSRNEEVWSRQEHSLSGKADDLDTADFTQERADRLKKHAEQMNLLAQKAKERSEEAADVHALFANLLKQEAAKRKKLGLTGTPEQTAVPA